MWLIEHIPRSEDKSDGFHEENLTEAKVIEAQILKALAKDLKRPWVLEFLQPPPNKAAVPVDLQKPSNIEEMEEGEIGGFLFYSVETFQ